MDKRTYLKNWRMEYEARTKRVNLTLLPREYERLVRVARRDGKAVTAVARELMLAAIDDRPHIPQQIDATLADIRFLISNVANNINQMAHYSHIVRSFNEEDKLLAELKRLQCGIEQFVRDGLRRPDDH
jgi:hypothetical protein